MTKQEKQMAARQRLKNLRKNDFTNAMSNRVNNKAAIKSRTQGENIYTLMTTNITKR